MRRIPFLVIVALLLIIGACSGGTNKPGKSEKPRNIILMIGDGMGTNHIYAGMVANGGKLNLEQFKHIGFQKTYSANSDITDSGASATSLSSGVKTKNGAIGVDTNGKPVKTILEYSRDNGLSTGILATSTITHATPASFASHNLKRGNYEEIAWDISKSGADFIMGGGRYHFNRRKDGINLLDSMVSYGYFIGERLEDIPADHSSRAAILADTMALSSMAKGRGELLVKSTEIGLTRLSKNPKGFFLMVEGSQIDWAAHAHNPEGVVSELIDFDKAVGKALEFAREDGNTLVIVTADHETGGFTLLVGGPKNPEIEGAFSTKGHTGVMVPVFAYGPGAEEFGGIYENTEIFEKMKMLLGL